MTKRTDRAADRVTDPANEPPRGEILMPATPSGGALPPPATAVNDDTLRPGQEPTRAPLTTAEPTPSMPRASYVQNAATAAYIAEAKTPSVIGFGQIRNALQLFAPKLHAAAQQAERFDQLAHDAEFLETDKGIDNLYREIVQKTGAVNRVKTEIAANLRALMAAEQELKEVNDRLLVAAGALGYTV